MKRSLKITMLTSALLCLIGTAAAAPTLYFLATNKGTAQVQAFPAATAAAPKADPAKPVISGHPASISFPSVRINNVPVIDGQFDAKTKEWTLTLHQAQYATMTPEPNDAAGNTYIYGHYRPEVFAYLHLIKPGAQAIITTTNGYKFTYTFQGSIDVPPTDTSLFNYQGPPVLTVQTCSGSWFQNRQLFRFAFEGVTKL